MKTILLMLLFAVCCSITAKAQIIYQPYTRQQQTPQANVQTVRTTAYYIDNNQIVKVPIKVQIIEHYGITNMFVSEYYVSNGMRGGDWKEILVKGKVQQCTPMFAENKLELQFMYKCSVFTTSSQWYYFDL